MAIFLLPASVFAQSGFVLPPYDLTVTRLNQEYVRLNWGGYIEGSDRYIVFVASPQGPWNRYHYLGEDPLQAAEYTVRAQAGTSWRFKVATLGNRDGDWMTSACSNEARDSYRLTYMQGGGFNGDEEEAPFPWINLTVDDFIPYEESREASYRWNENFGELIAGRKDGYFPAGVPVFLDVRVEAQQFFRAFFEVGYAQLTPALQPADNRRILSGRAMIGYVGGQVYGSEPDGFDSVTAPKGQMIPTLGTRSVLFQLGPDHLTGTYSVSRPGFIQTSQSSVPIGSSWVDCYNTSFLSDRGSVSVLGGAEFTAHSHPRRDLIVAIHRVYLKRYSEEVPEGYWDLDPQWDMPPNIPSDVEAQLNRTFGRQSNVFFRVWEGEPQYWDSKSHQDGGEDYDGNGILTLQDVAENERWVILAANNGADLTIMIAAPGQWCVFPSLFAPGAALRTPGPMAFTDSISPPSFYMHEIGHMLGLKHPFENYDNRYPSYTSVIPDDSSQRVMGGDYSIDDVRLISSETEKVHSVIIEESYR